MAHDSFEVSNENPTNTGHHKKEKTKGCFISLPVGFVLLLLAVLIAVGVGIIVLFAAGGWKVVCSCQSSGTGGHTAQQIRQECINLTKNGDPEICGACAAVNTTVTSTPASLTTTTPTPHVFTSYRLPTSVTPEHYDIELLPFMHDDDPKKFTFTGSVKILVTCHTATNNFTLHADVLTVNTSSIRLYPQTSPSSEVFNYVSSEVDRERQFFIVRLDRNLRAGRKYVIEMSFTSPFSQDNLGFYYSSYKRATYNHTVYLATTQFEATFARRAFPCFDEPAMKATFTMTLVRPVRQSLSLSNMPIANSNIQVTVNRIPHVKDVYQKTVKMSTYLLAFVVCDYGFLSEKTKNNVTVSTWAKPQSVNATRYALDVGVNITEFFEDYFEIKYPLPKQDMIAIPDFKAAAMENWGLITYIENYMLYEDNVSSQKRKEAVGTTVSHELAHQWFGNLVTMAWWSDAFLNEAFANFVSYLGINQEQPDWRMLDRYPVEEMYPALNYDSTVDSHPVFVEVQRPKEISKLFDAIIYSKGGSLIRMMRMFLGEKTFKQGIIKYLKKFSNAVVSHDDLWNTMTEQSASDGSKIDVKEIMNTWILQMNYPVVTVTRDFSKTEILHVSQDRFLADPGALDPGKYTSPYNYRWSIPLTFTSSKNPQFEQNHRDVKWIYKYEPSKRFDDIIPAQDSSNREAWILANVGQYGFYRVNYELGNWEALAKQLKTKMSVIPAVNRAQIINDAFALARASRTKPSAALDTLNYLNQERDYIPWSAAVPELESLDAMLYNTPEYDRFLNYTKDKLEGPFKQFGIENISIDPVGVLTQSLVAWHACYYRLESCVGQARKLSTQLGSTASRKKIDPNIRSTVYCHALAKGDTGVLVMKIYKDTDNDEEKQDILKAASCFRDKQIFENYLTSILNKTSPILEKEELHAIQSAANNNIAPPLISKLIINRYDLVKKWFPEFMDWIAYRTFTDATGMFIELQKVVSQGDKAFFQRNQEALETAKRTVERNIKWKTRSMPDIRAWLLKV